MVNMKQDFTNTKSSRFNYRGINPSDKFINSKMKQHGLNNTTVTSKYQCVKLRLKQLVFEIDYGLVLQISFNVSNPKQNLKK